MFWCFCGQAVLSSRRGTCEVVLHSISEAVFSLQFCKKLRECVEQRSVQVITEARRLDQLGQLGEVEQGSHTDSEQESNTSLAQRCVAAHGAGPAGRHAAYLS